MTESFPRDICILEEACILFNDDKVRSYDLAAAAVRQALASVPDCMSTQVMIKDIQKPGQELRKGVDTVVLKQNDVCELGYMLTAIQESHSEASVVSWEIMPHNQEALYPETVRSHYPLDYLAATSGSCNRIWAPKLRLS